LKICVLLWEVSIASSGSRFQSVMDLFTKEYFPMSVLCFLENPSSACELLIMYPAQSISH